MIFFNHVHADVSRKSRCGLIVGSVLSHVHSVMLVEISEFINGFIED